MQETSRRDYKKIFTNFGILIFFLVISILLGYAVGEGSNVIFKGNFPSHHAMYSLIIALSILIYYKKIGITLCIISLAIGIWRVLGGFHTPFEVIGGYILASMCVLVVNIMAFWVIHGD